MASFKSPITGFLSRILLINLESSQKKIFSVKYLPSIRDFLKILLDTDNWIELYSSLKFTTLLL